KNAKDELRLPRFLEKLFWQYKFESLHWPENRDLVIRQILCEGDRKAVEWLRSRVSDDKLRDWLMGNRGKHLSVRDIRFWQFMLEIPEAVVIEWLSNPARQIWDNRDK